MGHAYLQLGNTVQARDSLQEAVRLNPEKPEPWMDLGLVQQKSGDLGGAVQAYRAAMKIQATDVGFLLLARALEQSGRPAEAQTAMLQAKALSRNFDEAQRLVEQLLSKPSLQ